MGFKSFSKHVAGVVAFAISVSACVSCVTTQEEQEVTCQDVVKKEVDHGGALIDARQISPNGSQRYVFIDGDHLQMIFLIVSKDLEEAKKQGLKPELRCLANNDGHYHVAYKTQANPQAQD